MRLDARRFLACASAIMLRVAFAPRLRLAFGHRPFHRGAGLLLRLWCLCQVLGELGKLLFQGGILRLQLVDNMDLPHRSSSAIILPGYAIVVSGVYKA
jgi:hypothetical protein